MTIQALCNIYAVLYKIVNIRNLSFGDTQCFEPGPLNRKKTALLLSHHHFYDRISKKQYKCIIEIKPYFGVLRPGVSGYLPAGIHAT